MSAILDTALDSSRRADCARYDCPPMPLRHWRVTLAYQDGTSASLVCDATDLGHAVRKGLARADYRDKPVRSVIYAAEIT